jgi:hypothetical protein
MSKMVRSKNAGFVTVLVLLAIVVLLAMGTSLLKLGQNSRIGAVRGASEVVARCAADAGLAKAVFAMNEKLMAGHWDDGVLPAATNEGLANCDAAFSYTVTGDLGSGYVIESIGRSGQGAAEERVSCTLELQGPFEYAVFAEEGGIELKNSATINWYNYDESDGNLKVGTNSIVAGAVSLTNSATINGDVVVGVGGDPEEVVDLKNSSTITGDISALAVRYELTPVTVPAGLGELPSQGTLTNSTTLTSGEYKYDSINVANSKTVTIDGDVTLYVTGDVTLMNSSKLEIVDTSPNACLTLYLGGDYEGKNSSNMNNLTRDPKKLKIYGLESCRKLDFKNSTDFYGVIYTPDADVIFYNSADAFGAVAAKSFEQKNSATFNYDASLRQGDVSDSLARFVVRRWSEQ